MEMKEIFMKRCIEIAKKGLGNVSPNPMVGCVIVHKNKIISEGYHKKYGENHAEVNAINKVKNNHLLTDDDKYDIIEELEIDLKRIELWQNIEKDYDNC